jgi:hypothetical protein
MRRNVDEAWHSIKMAGGNERAAVAPRRLEWLGRNSMRKTLLAAVAAMAIFALAAAVKPAAAMTVAAPSALGVAAVDSNPVQQVRWRGWHPRRYWGPHFWGPRIYWGFPFPFLNARPWPGPWLRPWYRPWYRPWWGWRYHHWHHW